MRRVQAVALKLHSHSIMVMVVVMSSNKPSDTLVGQTGCQACYLVSKGFHLNAQVLLMCVPHAICILLSCKQHHVPTL